MTWFNAIISVVFIEDVQKLLYKSSLSIVSLISYEMFDVPCYYLNTQLIYLVYLSLIYKQLFNTFLSVSLSVMQYNIFAFFKGKGIFSASISEGCFFSFHLLYNLLCPFVKLWLIWTYSPLLDDILTKPLLLVICN